MLVDNGPLPTGDWVWYDFGTYWLISGEFTQALTDDMACTPANFLVTDDGTPKTINSVGTNLSGTFEVNCALPLPSGTVMVSQVEVDSNLTRESDGYIVFPWSPRVCIYES